MSDKVKNEIIEWIKSLGIAIIIGALILVFARPSLIIGKSMLPNFKHHDIVLVQKVSYFLHDPQRNDVVVCKTNMKLDKIKFMKKNIIKRVIGLPGDQVLVENGLVYINGKEIDQAYTLDNYTSGYFNEKVPDKHIFVLGDNRQNSNDSRSDEIGFIPFDKIQGKVYFRFWPFKRFGVIK